MTAKKVINGNADEEALEETRQYASPPCYQHEIDPLYQGITDDTNLPTDEVSTGITNQDDWISVQSWQH